jgi:serine O-acetyltransferase
MASEAPARAEAGWTEPAPDRPLPLWASLADDLLAHLPHELRGGSAPTRFLRRLRAGARSTGFHVTLLYRVAHTSRYRLSVPGRMVAAFVYWFVRHFYGCTISPIARLHGGLILPHPQGLVIGPGAVVGPFSWIFQNATIGGLPGRDGLPRVGRDARIYPGAVLVGPISIGDNAVIGANAVVDADVPAYHAVRCYPADHDPIPDHYRA